MDDVREITGHAAAEETSTAAVLRRAVDDGSQLVQKEIELARQEITAGIRHAAVALLAGVAALLGVVGALVMAITTVVIAAAPHWLAALGFCGLFLILAGAGTALAASRLRRINPLRQTIETIQEDVAWAKRQLRHDGR